MKNHDTKPIRPRLSLTRKISIGLAILIGALLSTVGIIFWIGSSDLPEQDFSDLKIEPVQIADEDNAYTHLIAAAKVLEWSIDRYALSDYLEGKPIDEAPLREAISRNTDALSLIDRAAQCSRCITPILTRLDDHAPHIKDWGKISNLLAAKFRHESTQGDYHKATNTCITQLKLSNLILQDSNYLLQHVIGCGMLAMALDQAERLGRDTHTPKDQLQDLAKSLDEINGIQTGLVRAIKGDFNVMSHTVDDFAKGLNEPNKNQPLPLPLPVIFQQKFTRGYLLQPNRTKLETANESRRLIKNVSLPHHLIEVPMEPEQFEEDPSVIKILAKPNSIGRILNDILNSTIRMVHEQTNRKSTCKLAATKLLIACRLFEIKHGNLPAKLEDLQPEFISSIPTDPYDGKPFRYSREKQILYSFGEDGNSSGNEADTNRVNVLVTPIHAGTP